ncbi:hypothetical protein BpHYR1_053691, partial [Brachionus plicatilis]
MLNTNVSKLNSENEAIKKLIIGVNNKPFTNRLRSEIIKRFVNDKGQTLGFYEKKFHNEMEEIKKDLLKLVPKNSNFKESWKKAIILRNFTGIFNDAGKNQYK